MQVNLIWLNNKVRSGMTYLVYTHSMIQAHTKEVSTSHLIAGVAVSVHLQPLRSPVGISAQSPHVGKLVVTCRYRVGYSAES